MTANSLTTSSTTPTITGTVDDSNATVVVTVNGQTATATVSGTTWTAMLATALADGTYDIAVSATDAAGNVGSATQTGGLIVETTPPRATITSTATDPTNVSPIPFTVTFSESVTGFSESGLTVTNGTIENFTAVSGTTYTFDIAPATNGAVTVMVNAGAAQDGAGNSNTATAAFSINFNSADPGVTLTTTSGNPTNVNPIPVTATFSEDVTGFTEAGLTPTNATISNFTAVSGSIYTFDLIPTGDGTVSVTIPAGVAMGSGGNTNVPSTPLSIVFDTTAPTITINQATTNQATPTITGSVDDASAKVEVTVNSNTVQAVVDGSSWTATFTTDFAEGTYDVSVTATDAAGNSSSNTLAGGLVVDLTAPTATITTTASDPTDVSPIPFTVKFSENVTGFSGSGLTVTNGTITNFAAVDDATYNFDITPTGNGTVTVLVNANAAQDSAGNSNPVSATTSITVSGLAPSVSLTTSAGNDTNASTIPVTAKFSADVTGFDAGDVTVNNGTVSNFTASSANTYTFDVTPAADGPVTVDVAANAAVDSTNVGNSAATTLTVISDTQPPTGSISATAAGAITGTSTDATSSVTNVEVSIFDGTNYWDGTAFSSSSEVFQEATTSDNFADWSYAFATPGSYSVRARLTDAAVNSTIISGTATVS